jgi:hypothetical protein
VAPRPTGRGSAGKPRKAPANATSKTTEETAHGASRRITWGGLAIAHDYELSAEPLKALFTAIGQQDQGPSIEAALADRGTTAWDAILATLDGFDAETYLLTALSVSAPTLTFSPDARRTVAEIAGPRTRSGDQPRRRRPSSGRRWRSPGGSRPTEGRGRRARAGLE